MSELHTEEHWVVTAFRRDGRVEIGTSYLKSVFAIILGLGIATFIVWANQDRIRAVLAGITESTSDLVLTVVMAIGIPFFLLIAAVAMVVGMIRRRDLTLTMEGLQVGRGPVIGWTAVRGYSVTRFRGGSDVAVLQLDPAAGHGKRKDLPDHLKIFSRNLVPIVQQCQQIALRGGTPD
ncbi:MAG: hypothetical protein ACTH2Q_12430 [Propionibacteriaceae bacterium]